MSKHTPGPWIGQDENGKLNSDHDWSLEDEAASSSEAAPIWAGGKVVAFAVHSSNSFSLRSHPSVDANARLIAAAPDLLAALQAVLHWIDDNCETTGFDAVEAQADAALAKAGAELFNTGDQR